MRYCMRPYDQHELAISMVTALGTYLVWVRRALDLCLDSRVLDGVQFLVHVLFSHFV